MQMALQHNLVFCSIVLLVLVSNTPSLSQSGGIVTEVCSGSMEKPKEKLVSSIQGTPQIDVVFLMDRSQSIRETTFNQARDLLEKILRKYYVVHPDFARVSIIVFAVNSIVAVDNIYVPLISCKLFQSNEIPNSVQWIKAIGGGTNLPRALDQAKRIFENSTRKDAKKVLWLLADGQHDKETDEHVTKALDMKQRLGVEIFTVGLGKPPYGWLKLSDEASLKELASDQDHYACIDQWADIVDEVYLENDFREYGDRVWFTVEDQTETFCGGTCSANAQCFCNATSVDAFCTCPPQYYPDEETGQCTKCPAGFCKTMPGFANCTADQCPVDDNPQDPLDDVFFYVFGITITFRLFIIIMAVLIVIIILIIIFCVLCCWLLRKRRRKKTEPATGPDSPVPMTVVSPSNDTYYIKKRPPPPPPNTLPLSKEVPPDYDDIIYGTVHVDSATLSRQKLQEGMEKWPEYMAGGVEARVVSGMAISSLDNTRWARTPGFRVKHQEILDIAATLDGIVRQGEGGCAGVTVSIQGKKYAVHENNGVVLEGRGPIGGRSENVMCAASTGDYIIVGKAPAVYDVGQCKIEVLRILAHFQLFDQDYSTVP